MKENNLNNNGSKKSDDQIIDKVLRFFNEDDHIRLPDIFLLALKLDLNKYNIISKKMVALGYIYSKHDDDYFDLKPTGSDVLKMGGHLVKIEKDREKKAKEEKKSKREYKLLNLKYYWFFILSAITVINTVMSIWAFLKKQ